VSDRAKEIRERLDGVARLQLSARWSDDLGGWIDCDPTPTLEEERAIALFCAAAPADLAWLLEERERLLGMLKGVAEMARDEDFDHTARLGAVLALALLALGEEPTP
jgi:hypothetical protein